MDLHVTDEARAILVRSLELGGVLTEAGGVRLHGARRLGGGFDIQVELAAAPRDGDEVIETEGLRIFVDPAVAAGFPDAVVAVEPEHDRIVVRAAGPSA
jgi:Fe-S cluster assembly iron-binding protein IscA